MPHLLSSLPGALPMNATVYLVRLSLSLDYTQDIHICLLRGRAAQVQRAYLHLSVSSNECIELHPS